MTLKNIKTDYSSLGVKHGAVCVLEPIVSYLDLFFMYEFHIYFLSTYYHRQNRSWCVLMVQFGYNLLIFVTVVVLSVFSHSGSFFHTDTRSPQILMTL